ncbi:uncharacterized protein [Rutidosis leptorrhynchoides]|uniref:uncharacterized protein n=1 Tax=Rutidosis leptorrhynchoides TaxID=125765 RepID=UPI003A98E597
MKIISYNVRGFGVVGKFDSVKNLCFRERPDIITFQETKCHELGDRWVQALWGTSDFGYVQKAVVGNSGGLLTIWDSTSFTITNAVGSDYFLAIRGSWVGSGKETIVVNVYGPHSDVNKKILWDSLSNLMGNNDMAWVLCGDFNEVREQGDRLNCFFHQRRATRFNDFIYSNSLIEIPLVGRKFTRISDDGIKFSKLDRFFATDNFINLWCDLSIMALKRKDSDHCSIMLRDKVVDFGPKPFKIFDEWYNKEGVMEVIDSAWSLSVKGTRVDCNFHDKLKNVKFALRDWSKNEFGSLDSEINSLKVEVGEWEKKGRSGVS